jgi:uncharacterized integral membrane protein
MVKTDEPHRDPATHPPGTPDSAPAPGAVPPGPAPTRKPPRTRAGSTWVMACVATIVLIILIVFIAQNSGPARISFFSLHGRFPLAVALLAAVAAGSVLTLVIGSTRILQLRRIVRRRRREDLAASAREPRPQAAEIPPDSPQAADPSPGKTEGKAVDNGADV